MPRFKSKKNPKHSFSFQIQSKEQLSAVDFINHRIKVPLPKLVQESLGKKKLYISFKADDFEFIADKINNITISEHAGQFFASINVEYSVDDPKPIEEDNIIGLDRGVTNYLTLSNGEIIKTDSALKKYEDQLKKFQRQLANKVEFNKKHYEKERFGYISPYTEKFVKTESHAIQALRKKIAKLHFKIAEHRKTIGHQISKQLVDQFDVVVLEDLKVSNMTKSAKGDAENHGKNVKQKAGLNRNILDQAWSSFEEKLKYKLAKKGGRIEKVDPKYTSQTCPACGFVSKENRFKEAFICVQCGHTDHADINGAKNILEKYQNKKTK